MKNCMPILLDLLSFWSHFSPIKMLIYWKKSNFMKIVYLSIHVSPPWACHALPSLPPRFCLVSCVILQAQLTHFCKILNSKIEVRTVTSPVYIGLATSFMVQKCLIYDYLLVVSLKCNIYQFNKLRNISNIER